MGAADLVPGISGGTIALITGIYPRLIGSLAALDTRLLRLLIGGQFALGWRRVDAAFLALLAAGIVTAIFSLAPLLAWLLQRFPIPVWAFFFGLIATSVAALAIRQTRPTPTSLACLLAGAAAVLLLVMLPTLDAPTSSAALPAVFAVGCVASCAMLLPGISGSLLLLLIGFYEPTLQAVAARDLGYLLAFGSGALAGLLAFSRLICWLLNRHEQLASMFLLGLLAGSLYPLWPWRSEAEPTAPVWPGELAEPMLAPALGAMFAAALLAGLFTVYAEHRR